ncbi:Fe-S oxidoreductase [Labilithrix luteola]|uniref:Fe-S oxidoreductase n=1 Tax=Labilithrix luteola TaxID=1391654 RepID=A0A0K1PS78_9BACT|nr:hypothetical protein [Labilithrix luteola]AKU96395.1 Fe-S oxidoreductase [Labilithrix luteola]
MAESNDRSSAKRNEDSGLIDLDALMRQADPSPPAESATPAASSAPAARTTPSLTETPAPVSSKAVPAAAVSTPASSKKASEEKSEKSRTPEPVASSKAVAAAAAPAAAASVARNSSRRADDSLDGVASPSVPPSSQLPASASAKAAEPAAAKAEAAAASTSTQERKRSKVVPLLAAAALLGLVGFTASRFLNSKAPEPTAAPLPTAVRTNEVAHAAPTPSEQPAETAAVDTKEPAPAESASAAPAERPRTGGGKHAAGPAAPAASVDPSLTLKEIQTAPSEQGDLAAAMRGAADGGYASGSGLADEPAKNANARQLRPSPGSVIGAINAVLPSARACLAPDDPIRKGSIVFSSDGSVQKVDMRGQKAEDECVRTALSKARVQPFVDDSFTTPVTVRP